MGVAAGFLHCNPTVGEFEVLREGSSRLLPYPTVTSLLLEEGTATGENVSCEKSLIALILTRSDRNVEILKLTYSHSQDKFFPRRCTYA